MILGLTPPPSVIVIFKYLTINVITSSGRMIMRKMFKMPPIMSDKDGNTRCAGFEFELGNLIVEEIAEALHAKLGGELHKTSPFQVRIRHSSIGSLKIERDTQYLSSLAYRDWLNRLGVSFGPGNEGEYLEKQADKISCQLIPCEIVTAPIPFDKLHRLNDLLEVLDSFGGKGTQEAIYYAFGLHINPSVPEMSCETLLAYIQAFILLNDWIIKQADTDISRRFFTKYIDPYPQQYAQLVIDTQYNPDMTTLIDDYLKYNPTRNRALDMLPIFFTIDAERVIAGVNASERNLIKGRPAFHYRLPDCRVGEKDWAIEDEWNRWQLIEIITYNTSLRKKFIALWQKEQAKFKLDHRSSWVAHASQFIKNKIQPIYGDMSII